MLASNGALLLIKKIIMGFISRAALSLLVAMHGGSKTRNKFVLTAVETLIRSCKPAAEIAL